MTADSTLGTKTAIMKAVLRKISQERISQAATLKIAEERAIHAETRMSGGMARTTDKIEQEKPRAMVTDGRAETTRIESQQRQDKVKTLEHDNTKLTADIAKLKRSNKNLTDKLNGKDETAGDATDTRAGKRSAEMKKEDAKQSQREVRSLRGEVEDLKRKIQDLKQSLQQAEIQKETNRLRSEQLRKDQTEELYQMIDRLDSEKDQLEMDLRKARAGTQSNGEERAAVTVKRSSREDGAAQVSIQEESGLGQKAEGSKRQRLR